MFATVHPDTFPTRLTAMAFHNSQVAVRDDQDDLDAVNDLLWPGEGPAQPEVILSHLHLQVQPRHPDVAWTYPAGEWHQSE